MSRSSSYRGHSFRYGADLEALGELRHRFIRLSLDENTRAWLDDAITNPHSRWLLRAKAVARTLVSDYDANGLVGAHDMRVLGEAQWRELLEVPEGHFGESLLDVGAGEGQVTDALAPLARNVTTTETSRVMAKKLRARGYVCHELDICAEPLPSAPTFDLVAALNVIDRTLAPFKLLAALGRCVTPGGKLLISVPLPLRPHVHVGPKTLDPEEILPKDERSFEAGVRALAERFFEPLGWPVERVARVPYLCRGGPDKPVLALDDAVFVCGRSGLRLSTAGSPG